MLEAQLCQAPSLNSAGGVPVTMLLVILSGVEEPLTFRLSQSSSPI